MTLSLSPFRRSLVEAKALFGLGLPIIIAHFAIVGMSLTDTVMAGQAGSADLAGLAISVNLWIPISIFLIGIMTAIVPLTAQYSGAKDHTSIGLVLRQCSVLGIGSGLAIAATINLGLPWVELLDAETKVTQVAQGYLHALTWGLPALIFDIALHSWLEGMGRVRPIMIIGLILLLLNVPLDYALVLGKWGLPALGGVGCGWATAALCWVSLTCTVVYILTHRELAQYRQHIFALPKWRSLKQILKIGVPLRLALSAEEGFISAIVLLSVPLGTIAIGGLQVMASYMMLIVVIAVGMGQAITIRVANAIGRGDVKAARFIAYQGIIWNLLSMSLACCLVLFSAEEFIELFSDNADIKAVALGLMWLAPLTIIPDALLQSINGVLRGYKDTVKPMLLLLLSYWGFAVPLVYFLIYESSATQSLGVTASYIGYITGFSCAALLLTFRLRRVLNRSIAVHPCASSIHHL